MDDGWIRGTRPAPSSYDIKRRRRRSRLVERAFLRPAGKFEKPSSISFIAVDSRTGVPSPEDSGVTWNFQRGDVNVWLKIIHFNVFIQLFYTFNPRSTVLLLSFFCIKIRTNSNLSVMIFFLQYLLMYFLIFSSLIFHVFKFLFLIGGGQ